MKHLKKVLPLLLLLPALTLCACGGGGTDTKESETQTMAQTAPATEPDYYVETTVQPLDVKDNLKLTGRAGVAEDGVHLDWSLAEVSFRGWFRGEIKADLAFGYKSVTDPNAVIRVVVDGDYENPTEFLFDRATKKLSGAVLATVEEGYHTVTVIKCSHARAGGINLTGLSFCGTLDTAPEAGKLKISIIGDSISCGSGVTAECTARQESIADDAYYSYGGLLSRNLNADVDIVAIPGWGIACGGMDETALIPSIYDQTNYFRDKGEEKWDFASNQPDVVIISLGTNDYRFANEGRTSVLMKAAQSFLATVREKNPDAYIIWIYGQMLNQYDSQLASMVKSFNDPKMAYFTVAKNTEGGYNHPSAVGHEIYAKFLTAQFEELGILTE